MPDLCITHLWGNHPVDMTFRYTAPYSLEEYLFPTRSTKACFLVTIPQQLMSKCDRPWEKHKWGLTCCVSLKLTCCLMGLRWKKIDPSPCPPAGQRGPGVLSARSLHRRWAQASPGAATSEPECSWSSWEAFPQRLTEPRGAEGEREGGGETLLQPVCQWPHLLEQRPRRRHKTTRVGLWQLFFTVFTLLVKLCWIHHVRLLWYAKRAIKLQAIIVEHIMFINMIILSERHCNVMPCNVIAPPSGCECSFGAVQEVLIFPYLVIHDWWWRCMYWPRI